MTKLLCLRAALHLHTRRTRAVQTNVDQQNGRARVTATSFGQHTHRQELGLELGSLLLPLRGRGRDDVMGVGWGATQSPTVTAATVMIGTINIQTKSKLALSASAICRCVA